MKAALIFMAAAGLSISLFGQTDYDTQQIINRSDYDAQQEANRAQQSFDQLGTKNQPVQSQPVPDDTGAATSPDTSQAVTQDQLRSLDQDLDAIYQAEVQAAQERAARQQAAQAQAAQQQAAKAQFYAEVAASKRMAIHCYPQCAIENSLFQRTMIQITDLLEQQDNPVVYSADAPFKVAQMAGNQLGIAPQP
jgi:hypothetical protein